MYVDDLLCAGTCEFSSNSNQTGATLDRMPARFDVVTFTGVHFKQDFGHISTDRQDYISKIALKTDGTYKAFASNCAKPVWIGYTRPGICATVAKLA